MELIGHSGCRLCVIDENGQKSVKKYSSDVSYNERLKAQMQKQSVLNLKGFKKCKVYNCGYEDGLFFFTMDYINGKTLADYMEVLELKKIHYITDILCANIVGTKYPNFEAAAVFGRKLASIAINERKKEAPFIKEAMKTLDRFSWEYVVPSICHGDLTLENVIVQGDDLLLIDCLDSFYDSWMIDIAKILQDVELMWSYRRLKKLSNNLIVRLTVMRDLILQKVESIGGVNILETLYHVLLNVLRVYPYTNDEETETFLDSKVSYLLNKIKARAWR